MAISSEGKIGIGLTLFFGLGAGALAVAWSTPWIFIVGWATITISLSGLVLLGLHHFMPSLSRKELVAIGIICIGATSAGGWYLWPPEKADFPFVFGAPLGENNSSEWIMLVKHYGENPAFNCSLAFWDMDRKNIEHIWLTAHPNSPFAPDDLAFGESQKIIRIAEIGKNSAPDTFTWKPLYPDRQHYSVIINCPEGRFGEEWSVTRVDGILRTDLKFNAVNQSSKETEVYRCTDKAFVESLLAEQVPPSIPAAPSPGWKPNHRFEFPVMIISPDRVLYSNATKRPDQGLPGCWAALDHHLPN